MNISSKPPEDFPYCFGASGLSGAAPKLSATLRDGRYFVTGSTPQERESQYLGCLELVEGYVEKCRNAKAGKFAAMSRDEILKGYLNAACAAHTNFTHAQIFWIFRQVADQLGWPDDAIVAHQCSSI